ncbi:MAG: phage baseplate assembly protein V [Bacillota bacterium]
MRAPTASSHDSGLDEMVRFGTIADVDLSTGHCTVDTGDVQTQAIRWQEVRAGDTRTWSPPTVGEQVILLCPGGQIEGAIALRGVHQDKYPPAGSSLRELITFKDGAEIAYDPEAHVLDAKLPGGGTVNIVSTGGVTIDASDGGVHIKGDVTVEGDVTADGVSLKQHTHEQVQPGDGFSGKPVQ